MVGRRFPKPWTAVETPGGWRVDDAEGMPVAYVYGEPEGTRKREIRAMSPDEARRIAANIAKLPDLLDLAKRVGLDMPQNDERPATPEGSGP